MKKQDKQCICKCNIGVHSHNHCCCGKAGSITYSECVSVALVIQHALCIRCIILSSVTTFFSHYLINSTVFGKELLDINCALWFSLPILSATFLTVRRTQRDITNVYESSSKYLLFLSDCNETWLFSIIKKKTQMSWKSIQWELSCSMQMDRHMNKLTHRQDMANKCSLQFC